MKKKVQFWLDQQTKVCIEAEARKYGISLTAWMTWLINLALIKGVVFPSGKGAKEDVVVFPFETEEPLSGSKGQGA